MKKRKSNDLNLNIADTNSLFEGLDLSIFLSIVNFLALYYFKSLDYNLTLVLTICVVLSSFFIRIAVPVLVSKLSQKISYYKLQLFLLIIGYGLPLIVVNDLFYGFSIILFLFSRIVIGIYFGLSCSQNFENNNEKIMIHSDVKYWFFFIIGIFLGFVSTQVLNDIFSNTSLSNGSWKWVIIFLIIPNLVKLFFLKKRTFYYESLKSYFSSFEYKLDKRLLKSVFENIIVLIPITLLILYSSSFWLPSSVLPENKQFSEILFINVILVLIAMVCSHFIFELISKIKSYILVSYSGIFIFLILGLYSGNFSSYSISLLHFVVSIYSGISLALFNFSLVNRNFQKSSNSFISYSILLIFAQILIPIFIYILIFNIVQYKFVYLFLFFLYSLSLLGYYVLKKQEFTN